MENDITQIWGSSWKQMPIWNASKLQTIEAISKCWMTVTTNALFFIIKLLLKILI